MPVVARSGQDANNLWTIDSTSKAGRVTPYDKVGNPNGQKASYAASTTIRTAGGAAVNNVAALFGTASKIVRVQRVRLSSVIATTAAYVDVYAQRATLDDFTAYPQNMLTPVALDSNSPPANALVGVYGGTVTLALFTGGPVLHRLAFAPITGTPGLSAAIFEYVFNWTDESQSCVLRNANESFSLWVGSPPATNAPTYCMEIVWTEELMGAFA